MILGFIGTGKISSSIIFGIFKSKLKVKRIYISSRNRNIAKKLANKYRKIKVLTKKDKKKFIINLNKIGYCFFSKNKSFFLETVKAFQRRFRKELINGVLDQECFMIAQNLSKKV